jgi:hypothetical protein
MSIRIANGAYELLVAEPGELYRSSRFDWCGQIASLRHKGIEFAGAEKPGASQDDALYGRGFQGEFGIKAAVGFDDCPMGGLYPKIGVGWLVKDAESYDFYAPHAIEAHRFKVESDPRRARFLCESGERRGYAYRYVKELEARADGFDAHYCLENLGSKPIATDEYCHNFMAPEPIGPGVEVELGFEARAEGFAERVDPEGAAPWEGRILRFAKRPTREYYFGGIFDSSHGALEGEASWVARFPMGVEIEEKLEGPLARCALWGSGHVISPELFVAINLAPGASMRWKRSITLRER